MLISRFYTRWMTVLLALTMFLSLLQRLYRRSDTYRYRHTLDYIVFEDAFNESHTNALGFLPRSRATDVCRAHRWAAYPHRRSRRKVYDLFMVNNEIDMLKIRLNELYRFVDYFVILEANTTFTGLPKSMISDTTWETDFGSLKPKIIRRTLIDPGLQSTVTWDHEDLQRNAMFDQVLPMLSGAQKPEIGDVIIVSDVDEIPRSETLTVLRNCDFPRRLTLRSRFYYYSFQWLHRGEEWAHPQVTTYADKKTIRPANLRNGEGGTVLSNWLAFKDKADLWNASWHCSFCFSTLEATLRKISSSSHTMYDTDEFRDRAGIVERVRAGRDLFDREEQLYEKIEGNTDIPGFLKANAEEFQYMLNRDGEDAGFRDF